MATDMNVRKLRAGRKKATKCARRCSPGSSIENEGLWARTEFRDEGRDKDRSLTCLMGDRFLSPLPFCTGFVLLGLEDMHLELKVIGRASQKA